MRCQHFHSNNEVLRLVLGQKQRNVASVKTASSWSADVSSAEVQLQQLSLTRHDGSLPFHTHVECSPHTQPQSRPPEWLETTATDKGDLKDFQKLEMLLEARKTWRKDMELGKLKDLKELKIILHTWRIWGIEGRQRTSDIWKWSQRFGRNWDDYSRIERPEVVKRTECDLQKPKDLKELN